MSPPAPLRGLFRPIQLTIQAVAAKLSDMALSIPELEDDDLLVTAVPQRPGPVVAVLAFLPGLAALFLAAFGLV
jgi:hypothetical protein